MDGIREVGFALSPLFLVLFACEMARLQDMYDKDRLSERQMCWRVTYFVLKLPASLLLPAFLQHAGVALICALDALSVIAMARPVRHGDQ